MSTVVSPRTKECISSAPSQNIERRRNAEIIPSRIVPLGNNSRGCISPRQDIKSRYCSEEVRKSEFGTKVGRNDSAPAERNGIKKSSPSVEELRQRDVNFLRKMLAMNKKQEMMLNMKLAKLMEEEEFHSFSDRLENNKCVDEQPSPLPVFNADKHVKDLAHSKNDVDAHVAKFCNEIPSYESKLFKDKNIPKTTSARKIQYDINGRRVYHYSDIENESVKEKIVNKREVDNTTNPNRPGNSNKMNKKGSASSKKTFTMKKSLTYINKEGRILKKAAIKSSRKVRKEDGDSPSCEDSENPLEFELRPKKVDSQGDGGQVQNVVVHCSTTYSNNSMSKKNFKVWNYESLHSMNSDHGVKKNKTFSSNQRLLNVGNKNNNDKKTPISVRNNNIQIKFKSPSPKEDETGSKTLETLFFLRNKYTHVDN